MSPPEEVPTVAVARPTERTWTSPALLAPTIDIMIWRGLTVTSHPEVSFTQPPEAGSQLSTVQVTPSSQSSAGPEQLPSAPHTDAEQGSPSSQG